MIDQPSPAAPNADPAAYIIVEAEPFSELEQSAPEAISIILVGPVLYGALWHSTAAALAAYVCDIELWLLAILGATPFCLALAAGAILSAGSCFIIALKKHEAVYLELAGGRFFDQSRRHDDTGAMEDKGGRPDPRIYVREEV